MSVENGFAAEVEAFPNFVLYANRNFLENPF